MRLCDDVWQKSDKVQKGICGSRYYRCLLQKSQSAHMDKVINLTASFSRTEANNTKERLIPQPSPPQIPSAHQQLVPAPVS